MGLFSFFKNETKTKESLNTYIDNLGFTPTRICTTLNNMIFSGNSKGYSQKTLNIISQAMTYDKTKYGNYFWAPELGIFMNANQKVFTVRSDVNETIPKVYSFSQLQSFEVSEDIRKSMQAAVFIPYVPVVPIVGGSIKGNLSMRVVLSGANGPESVMIQPLLNVNDKNNRVNINDSGYKLRYMELTAIADCLQWIHDNA